MSILYLECGMGAAGDMLAACLLELMPDPDGCLRELNALGIPNVEYTAEKVTTNGIGGTKLSVKVNGEEEGDVQSGHHKHHCAIHHGRIHRDMDQIMAVIDSLNADDGIKEKMKAIYRRIADAESRVHGVPVEEIHFHEVGALDAVADVAAVCWLIDKLGPDRTVISPVNTGKGTVRCAHGLMPVPAPATAELLRGISAYCDGTVGELLTPTGAALIGALADEFGDMPRMTTERIGYGVGRKTFARPNCVRAFFGREGGDAVETVEITEPGSRDDGADGWIWDISCNVDDMTGEEVAFAREVLMQAGARDVFTIPVGMKKSRIGILIHLICDDEKKEELIRLLFKHTSTLGARVRKTDRRMLERELKELETPWGIVRRKDSNGYGTKKSKWEYEDLARIAVKEGKSLAEVRNDLEE